MKIGANKDKWQSSLVKPIAIALLAGIVGLFTSSAAYAIHKAGHEGGGDRIGKLSCTEGMIAKFVGGAWTCAEDEDTNTNAATLCGTELFLDGDGNCVDLFALIDDLQDQIDALHPPKTVFTTSASFNGNLGGLAGADTKCQVAADSGIVPAGVYVAWLSTGAVDARNRIPDASYILPDGTTPIALSKPDLLDGVLLNLIDQDQFGDFRDTLVWTGTLTDGTVAVGTCADWTVAFDEFVFAIVGSSTVSTFGAWTNAGTQLCLSNFRSLYCFEQ